MKSGRRRLSESFAAGKGNVEHNLRICKGTGNDRMRGDPERRDWNKILVRQDVDAVIEREFGEAINKYNNEQILGKMKSDGNRAKPHPERCMTMNEWKSKQENGKGKHLIYDYVVQLGDKMSSCCYEIEKNSDGIPLNTDGKRLNVLDTRETPKAKLDSSGRKTKSAIAKDLEKVYEQFLDRFRQEFPDIIIVSAAIHNDEEAGCHMHISCIFKSEIKSGIGYGTGKTTWMSSYMDRNGIQHGKTRKDNAQKIWTAMCREMLFDTAAENGIDVLNMGLSGTKHRDIPSYKKYADARSAEIKKGQIILGEEKANLESAWHDVRNLQREAFAMMDMAHDMQEQAKKNREEFEQEKKLEWEKIASAKKEMKLEQEKWNREANKKLNDIEKKQLNVAVAETDIKINRMKLEDEEEELKKQRQQQEEQQKKMNILLNQMVIMKSKLEAMLGTEKTEVINSMLKDFVKRNAELNKPIITKRCSDKTERCLKKPLTEE